MIAHTLYLLSGPIRFAASDDDAKRLGQEIRDQTEELARLRAEVERLRAENAALVDVLRRNGFRPCDVPACNCGSWHMVGGLRERMDEIKEALADAGHPLSNDNGNLPLNALSSLVAERDALRAEVERLRSACSRENDAISQVLGRALDYPRFADDQKNFPGATDADGVCVGDHVAASLADEAAGTIRALRAEVERLRRMSEDASRYRWLRDWLRKVGLLEYIKAAHRPDGTHGPATVLRRPDVINGSELVGWSAGVGQGFDDAAIDAARAAQEGKA